MRNAIQLNFKSMAHQNRMFESNGVGSDEQYLFQTCGSRF